MKKYELKLFDGVNQYPIKNITNPERLKALIDGDSQGTRQFYATVAWLYSTIQWVAKTTASIPLVVVDTATGEQIPIDDLPFKVMLNQLIFKWSLSDSLYGASYAEKVKDGRGNTVFVKYLNATTMSHIVDFSSESMDNIASFTRDVEGVKIPLEKEDLTWHFRPDLQEVGPGLPPADVVSDASELLRAMLLVQVGFFERGAMPLTLIQVPASTQERDKDALRSRFDKAASVIQKGLNSVWNSIAVSSDVTIQTLSQPINTLQLPELDEGTRMKIFGAFNLTEAVITGKASNRAVLDALEKSAITVGVLPVLTSMIESLNHTLFNEFGLTLKENHQALSIFQADETARADSVQKLVNSGMPLMVALEVLGYDLTDEQREAMTAPSALETPPQDNESKILEIGKLKKFVKSGKHLRRSFTSDILTKAEINHIVMETVKTEDNPFL